MKIGFVNFNSEERNRVSKMMQVLQEAEAIEELGIGRVRDHFSNALFPGTSTLQHHAKYFAVLPSLYYYTAYKAGKFKNVDEVDAFIKKAEVQITRQLAENEDGTLKTDVKGITGINIYKDALKDYHNYVKYDPAYIYGNGLQTYGLVPTTNITRLLFELNKKYYSTPHNDKEQTEDSEDVTGNEQIIKTSGESYDFFNGKTMSLALTEQEAIFLKNNIASSCKEMDSGNGKMLFYLIERPDNLPENLSYFDLEQFLGGLNSEAFGIYRMSVLFSKLVNLLDWRYNYVYFYNFDKNEEASRCNENYLKLHDEYSADLNNQENYRALFSYIYGIDQTLTDFCRSCYEAIMKNDAIRVDQLVISREQTVKRERSKIGNSAYHEQGRGDPSPNTFRWDTVQIMVNEIRNPKN